MKKDLLRSITSNAVVTALYFILTIITSSVSFLGVQIRIAEVLVLLCFFRRDYIFGCTLGCVLANLLSPIGAWDILFGSLATLLSCLLISFSKRLFIATFIPVIINAFVVGTELFFILEEPFWINCGLIALGEFVSVCIFGYILFMILCRESFFFRTIRANKNIEVKW